MGACCGRQEYVSNFGVIFQGHLFFKKKVKLKVLIWGSFGVENRILKKMGQGFELLIRLITFIQNHRSIINVFLFSGAWRRGMSLNIKIIQMIFH